MRSLVLQHTAVAVERDEDYEWLETAEACLGSRKRRYLGAGYKRVRHVLTGAAYDPAERTLAATADVIYPDDWSQKAGGARSDTHVSTIDNLLLAVRGAELFLSRGLSLSEDALRHSRIVGVSMMLGAAPTTALLGLPFTVRHVLTRDGAPGDPSVTTLEMRLGQARTILRVRHPRAAADVGGLILAPDEIPSILAGLNDTSGKLYGDGYAARDIELTDISLDKRSQSLTCIMRLRHHPSPAPDAALALPRGIGASRARAIDVIDLMVSAAQVSQVLIYRSRGLDRDATGNLWMRNFTATCEEAVVGLGASIPVAAQMQSQVIGVDGAKYCVVEVEQSIPGIAGVRISGSFALKL